MKSVLRRYVFAVMALLAAEAQAQVASPPSAAKLALAQQIVAKMRTVEQQRFLLTKIGPVFASQVIVSLRNSGPAEIQTKLGSDAGRAQVSKTLSEEFAKAFEKRLPDLQTAIAIEFATRMSDTDLRATEAFLGTPAGENWAKAMVSAQIEGSAAGQRIGSEAGAEAAQIAMKRLEVPTP